MQKLDWFDSIGDWNPQLFRELKGRLKLRNLTLAVTISLLGQFLLWVYFLMRMPHPTTELTVYKGDFPSSSFYCTGAIAYERDRTCLVDGLGNLLVDWQRWSLDLFLALSIIGILSLLVVGTYLLIDNLAQEERQGTLNFIRLSPRSPQNILLGKILGVPILLYITVLSAVPLQLWAGLSANISLIRILSFYSVVVTSCVFFYSLSLLFSLISSRGLNGFQALLGNGAILLFILLIGLLSKGFSGDVLDGISVFSFAKIYLYLISATAIESRLHWFNLPVGMSLVGITSIAILNYSLWTYWIWQAIERCFANFSKTILSKLQSYWFVACFEVVALGFAINSIRYYTGDGDSHHYRPGDNFIVLLVYNFVLFCSLIVILTPQRQTLIDWARYRNQKPYSWNSLIPLLKDLVWGENSPAIVAITLNAVIAAIVLIPWIMLEMDKSDRFSTSMALIFNLCLMVVCAAISQLVALMRTKQQKLWIVGTLGAVVILPPLIILLFSLGSVQVPTSLLFTIFAFAAIKDAGVFSILLALLGQLSIITLCSVQIKRQLKKAGASNSIGLFAPPKAQLP